MIITVESAKKYVRLPNTVTPENYDPFIPDATAKYLQPYFGDALLLKLDEYSDGSIEVAGEAKPKWDTLLDLTRRSLSRFTFFLATPSLDVNITEGGFSVTSTQQMAPASKERVGSFKESMEDLGYQALDGVLKFLDDNQSVFTEWTASDAFKAYDRGFIRSAAVFQKYIDIQSSRLKFFALRQAMDRVEALTVIPILGQALATALKAEEVRTEPVMDTIRAEALNLARRCVAYHTAADEIDSEKYSQYKELFVGLLRDHLNSNPTKFVELFPAGSTTTTPVSLAVENTLESKHFHFGG